MHLSNPQPPPKKNFPTSFLPLVSKGMSSQLPGVSAGHLYTAPALSTPGCPDSALGAPTNSLQEIRGKGKCGIQPLRRGHLISPTRRCWYLIDSPLSNFWRWLVERMPLSLIPSSILALAIFHQANASSHDCGMQRESGTDMHVTGPGDPVGPGGFTPKMHSLVPPLSPSHALAQNDSLGHPSASHI